MVSTIRGIYDGKTVRPLPGEPLPNVEGEVMVEVVMRLEPQCSSLGWKSALSELRRKRVRIPCLQEILKASSMTSVNVEKTIVVDTLDRRLPLGQPHCALRGVKC